MAVVGTTMDYVEDDLRSEFVFNNPNEKVINYNLFLGIMWMRRKLLCMKKY